MKKDQTLASLRGQEPETDEPFTKEDQSQPNAALSTKISISGSPSHDNAPSLNQHYLPAVLHWPCPDQHAVDPTQSPSPIMQSQGQQLAHPQQNPASKLAQYGQPPQFVQPTAPFCMLQRPVYPLSAANAPTTFQLFTPLGTNDFGWQAPGAIGGGTSSSNQPQISNFCYPVGYTYPAFPGTWDPSHFWGQAQQSQSPCTYNVSGAYGYNSLPQSFQRGIIRPEAKLPQKHQKLWDAQSAENVQLWNVINRLQAEIVDYKNRLIRLEIEVSSLKPNVGEPIAQVIGTCSAGQPSKRGKPKKRSANALPSLGESHPRTRARISPPCTTQPESKSHIFEKVILYKVEDRDKASHSGTMEPENNENISNIVTTHTIDNMDIKINNPMMPALHNQVRQEFAGVQIGGFGLNSSSEMKIIDGKVQDLKTGNLNLSQQAKEMANKGASKISSEACGRLSLGTDFHDRQEGKIISGWSFANEEDASEELEDAVVGSTKDENEEEMEDDTSSAEEIAQKPDEGTC
ncbi:hypothetical protein ACB092_02G169300 [Castanea dentata]